MKAFNILILIFIIFTANLTFSQTDNLTKSEKIETIAGNKYYIHVVQKKQTVYSICKLYKISEKELVSNNPTLFDGLKIGQELKIPVKTNTPKSKDYVCHIVESKQTAYFIAHKYGISVDELFILNPEAKNGLKVGQELKIKKQISTSIPKLAPNNIQITENKTVIPVVDSSETVKKKNLKSDSIKYIKHKVRKKETLYSISKMYNITSEDIMSANPLVRANGLKKGEIINIPVKEEKIEEELSWEGNNSNIDTLVSDSSNCVLSPAYDNQRVIKIGVLLPFELDIKTLNLEITKQETSPTLIRANTKPFFEFYQGLLLSLKQFKKDGYSFDLYVYDTRKSAYTAKSIILKPEIKQLDFVIGPIYQNVFDTVAKYMPSKIPLINPLIDVSSSNSGNTVIMQNKFSKEILHTEIIKHLIKYHNVNYIIIHNGKQDEVKTVEKYKDILLSSIDSLTDTITIKTINFNDGKRKAIKEAIAKNRTNIVVIPSLEQGFVTNVITNLHVAAAEDSVILIGMEEWLKYNIETKYYHSLYLTVFKNRYVNYKDKKVLKFQKEFMNEYGGVPSIYSFVGFDTFKYYTNAFICLTDDMSNCLDKYKETGLSQNYSFEKINTHFINNGLFIVQYKKDLTIELLKE